MRTKFELPEQSYKYLFENVSDAIWVHDVMGNIIAANKACGKLTGYTREELIGTNVKKFLTDKSLGLAREVQGRLLNGESLEEPY